MVARIDPPMCCTIDRHIYPGLITCLAITKKVQRIVHSHPANSGIKVRQWTTLRRSRQITGEMNHKSSDEEGKMGDKEDNTEGSSPYACVIKINTVKAL